MSRTSRREKKEKLSPEQKREQRRRKREIRKRMREDAGLPSTRNSNLPAEKPPHEEQQFWLGVQARMKANKILNTYGQRAYWLSIVNTTGMNPPMSGFYPCTMFQRRGRWYFGFLFREHRDRLYIGWRGIKKGARKELTGPGQIPLFQDDHSQKR